MKKQDILTPVGLLLGVAIIIFGMSQDEAGIGIFYQASGIAITVGGSFAAVLVTYPIEEIRRMFELFKISFTSSNVYKEDLIDQFKEISRRIRKEGALSLEDYVAEIEDDFLRKGLELVIDGIEPEDVKQILELEINEVEADYNKGSKMFKVWGSYAPAFGMIGTLIGLIQMLSDLGTPEMIASGMSTALITTFYGAILANMVLNPIGFNIQNKGQKEVEYREMMLCGIESIQEGDSGRVIEEKLVNFLNAEEKYNYYNQELEEELGEEFEEGADGGVA